MEALMIGVSGLRGTVGGTLTPAVVSSLAAAFATWLKETQKPRDRHFHVVFGRDSRPSGAWVRDAAVSALVASGIEVIDLEVVTTPGVAMMIKHLSADAGLIATASHNPIEWNGIKYLNAEATALPAAEAGRLSQMFHEGRTSFVRVQELIAPTKNSETHALHIKR